MHFRQIGELQIVSVSEGIIFKYDTFYISFFSFIFRLKVKCLLVLHIHNILF